MVTPTKIVLSVLITLFLNNFAWNQELIGRIVDEDSQRGVPFAKVGFPSLSIYTSTDSLGNFSVQNAPNTRTKVKVTAFGYETVFKDISLKNDTLILFLEPSHTVFEEVVVTASEGKLQRENITAVEVLSKKELFATGATNLGDALIIIPGVQTSSVGTGISKPVIRGLSGMRVVTYWNGLRIENQQWGGDHGMGVTELGLQGIEVLKGPSSLLYGADALGGVIHFIDESYAAKNEVSGYASTKFESNSLGTTNEAGYKINKGKWRANFFGNYVNHSDFQLANGDFIDNSRFWGTNFKANIGFRNKNYLLNIRYHGTYNQLGLPGHTHSEDPEPSDFVSDSRSRAMSSVAMHVFNNFITVENKLFFNRSDLLIQIGNTNNRLKEFDGKVTLPFLDLNLNNSTYNIRYTTRIKKKIELKVGAQGMYQITKNNFPVESFLIPDARTVDNGLYSLINLEFDKWRLQGGLRFDVRNIESFKSNADSSILSNIDNTPLNKTYENLNYTLGFVRNSKKTTFRLNISSGFRSPHLAELQSDGFHHGALRYEKGNRNLVSEKALQFDGMIELHFDHLEFSINPYFNLIENFIYLQNEGGFEGGLPVFQFEQAKQAYLYGGELGFHYHPHQIHRLHFESNFSITIAEDYNRNALSLIPQPNSNSRIRFDINNKQKLQVKSVILEHQYFLPQYRVGQNEIPTVDFHLINLSMQIGFKNSSEWSASMGVRNVLNTSYVGHLSALKNLGLNQPGINFFGSIKYHFNKSINNK